MTHIDTIRSRRRLWSLARRAALAVVLVGSSSLAVPSAQADPNAAFTHSCPDPDADPPPPEPTPGPEGDCTPREGQAIKGIYTIRFTASATGNAERLNLVDLRIVSEEEEAGVPSPGNPVMREQFPEFNEAPSRKDYTYAWDTNLITPYNGRYKLEVRVRTQNLTGNVQEQVFSRIGIRVDNPPVTPRKPVIVSSSSAGVSVRWDPAPEPDVETYTLYRARTSGPGEAPQAKNFARLLDTRQTEVLDEISEPGAYWYRLRVTRRSAADPEAGIASGLSPPSDDPGVITKPTPAPGQGGSSTARSPSSRSRAGLQARPLSRLSARPAPVPDAPFSTVLDYGDEEEYADDGQVPNVEDTTREDVNDARGRTLPAAIGVFMISAWAVLTRSRVLV